MRYIVLGLLLSGAFFCLPFFRPAKKAWLLWPYGLNVRSWLPFVRNFPSNIKSKSIQFASSVSCANMGIQIGAIMFFLTAALGLLWGGIYPNIWPAIVVGGASFSAILYIFYFNRWAILPLLVDAVLLWGIFSQGWTNWWLMDFNGLF